MGGILYSYTEDTYIHIISYSIFFHSIGYSIKQLIFTLQEDTLYSLYTTLMTYTCTLPQNSKSGILLTKYPLMHRIKMLQLSYMINTMTMKFNLVYKAILFISHLIH